MKVLKFLLIHIHFVKNAQKLEGIELKIGGVDILCTHNNFLNYFIIYPRLLLILIQFPLFSIKIMNIVKNI